VKTKSMTSITTNWLVKASRDTTKVV
jgi:hypothetical protein